MRGSMIPVDLSANCDGWIYYLNGSGIQIPGSTDMSDYTPSHCHALRRDTPRLLDGSLVICDTH